MAEAADQELVVLRAGSIKSTKKLTCQVYM